jgi:small subunit ribosomal protein S16
LGSYNPNTSPATIELDFDRALDWLQKGAQPTDTCRAILHEQGVLLKNHLLNGVKKNAFTVEVAEQRFQAWLTEKENKITAQVEKTTLTKAEEKKKLFEAEVKANEVKAQAIAKKKAELAAAAAAKAKAEQPEVTEEPKEEPKAE